MDFIFHTDAKNAENYPHTQINGLHILGLEKGKNEQEALDSFLNNNRLIRDGELPIDNIKSKVLLTPETVRNISILIDYLWEDEYRHWEELECPGEHVFMVLKQIKESL